MKVVNVKLVSSPDKVRLVINDNIKFEGEAIDYETLFRYIQSEAKETININLHHEFTPDLEEYDNDVNDIRVISAGEAIVTDIGEPVGDDEECEHLHWVQVGYGDKHQVECMDCGADGFIDWGNDEPS